MRGKHSACSFTGHRPGKLPWGMNEADPRCQNLKKRLWDAVEGAYQEGIRHFICGMALGCDLFFAEEVLRLRQMHPEVTLEAAIPCLSILINMGIKGTEKSTNIKTADTAESIAVMVTLWVLVWVLVFTVRSTRSMIQ